MIETERLILRPWRVEDVAEFARATNTPAVMEFLGGVRDPEEFRSSYERVAASQEKNGFCFWIVERLSDGALLGFCGLKLGNTPPIVGRPAIREAVAGFFAAIGGCRHRLVQSWTGPDSAVCEGEVTYTRLDGSKVTIPFVNVFKLGDGRITSYRIYIDNGPLFSPGS